jgi:hypothetical protein
VVTEVRIPGGYRERGDTNQAKAKLERIHHMRLLQERWLTFRLARWAQREIVSAADKL